MLDLKHLRADPQAMADNLARRGYDFDVKRFTQLEAKRKTIQTETEQLQNRRNTLSKEIGKAKGSGKSTDKLMAEVSGLGTKLDAQKEKLARVQEQLTALLLDMPNLLDAQVPDGMGEESNRELRRWGKPKKFDFKPRDHVALGEEIMGVLDQKQAARMSGARFSVLHGELALLHRALGQFMLEIHIRDHDYHESVVPYLVNADSLLGTGQLPKFREDIFAVEGEEHFLIPTAEVPLTNLLRGTILEVDELPWLRVAHTPCFRAEAGSYGKDTRGLIRQHQFDKVELVAAVHPDDSEAALETLTAHAEVILQRLKLPYRVVSLCAGDIGFAAARTYDLEVWMPGQQTYREVSSCSNFRTFQARRLKARFRPSKKVSPRLLHTLNGSGLAVGRTLVAVMENYQRKDGTIEVPKCLSRWMRGIKVLGVK